MPEEYLQAVRDTGLSLRPDPDATIKVEVGRGKVLRLINREGDRDFYRVVYRGELYYLRKRDAVDYHGDVSADEIDADDDDAEEELDNEEDDLIPMELSDVPRRYTALQTISGLIRFAGWIVLLGGSLLSVAGGLVASSDEGSDDGTVAFVIIGGVAFSVITGIILLAVADIILLFIDVERNTRAAAIASMTMEEGDE